MSGDVLRNLRAGLLTEGEVIGGFIFYDLSLLNRVRLGTVPPAVRGFVWWAGRALLMAFLILPVALTVRAEVVAPSVHWGALAYPDAQPLLSADLTLNRFTRFGGSQPYNAILDTSGFNFITLSWTEHWQRFQGWSTNLTVGAGPTRDEPSRGIQNLIHDTLGYARVPVGRIRETNDFMIDGSATKWWDVFGPNTLFAGAGGSSGSLYHELFARAGLRRVAPIPGLDFFRVSAMGRASQLFGGSAFQQVAPQSYLGQASIAIGSYTATNEVRYELEWGFSIDSGLFVNTRGSTLEERFGTFALRFPWFTFEMWNDSWAPPKWGEKDNGPTGGGRLMFDVIRTTEGLQSFYQWIRGSA